MTRWWTVTLVLGVIALASSGCPKRPAFAPIVGAPAAVASVRREPGAVAEVPPPTIGAPPLAAPAIAGPPVLPVPQEFVATAALRNIYFDFDRYEIRPGDAAILERNAAWLKAHPTAQILIEGHCDERGTNEYNLALGQRRATAARDYLVTLGIGAARIILISYGEERPVCIRRDEACWAQNRRAHFLVKFGTP